MSYLGCIIMPRETYAQRRNDAQEATMSKHRADAKGNEWTRKPRETREAGWLVEGFRRKEPSRFEPLNLRGDDTGSGARTALAACSSDNPFARTRVSALQSPWGAGPHGGG